MAAVHYYLAALVFISTFGAAILANIRCSTVVGRAIGDKRAMLCLSYAYFNLI